MVHPNEFALPHRIFYLAARDALGIAGWIKDDEHPELTARMEGLDSLLIELLKLQGGGQHWGWVNADSLAGSANVKKSEFVHNFFDLATGGLDVAIPELHDRVIRVEQHRTVNPFEFWWGDIPLDLDNLKVYYSAGFAMDCLHSIKTAALQGVKPEDVKIYRKRVRDERGYVSCVFDAGKAMDLRVQPLYWYI